MSAGVKYTLGRLGLFALVAAVLLPFRLNVFLTLMIALVVSMVLSYFLLKRWRDEFAAEISESGRRRRERKEQLRAALAGEDEPTAPPAHEDEPTTAPPEGESSAARPAREGDVPETPAEKREP